MKASPQTDPGGRSCLAKPFELDPVKTPFGERCLFRIPVALTCRLSKLPLASLYRIAPYLQWVLAHGVRFRRQVAWDHLRRAFPEKSEREIRQIGLSFYRHLAEMVVETIALLSISRDELQSRCRIREADKAMLERYYKQNKSVIALQGHYGNWEWSLTLATKHLVMPVYSPLNRVADILLRKSRGRFAYDLIPTNQVIRKIKAHAQAGQPYILGLIADQWPKSKPVYRALFLGENRPVFTGPEKLARRLNLPVIFVSMRKQSRGRYELHMKRLTDSPADLPVGELSRRYLQSLEQEIRRAPDHWLWTLRKRDPETGIVQRHGPAGRAGHQLRSRNG